MSKVKTKYREPWFLSNDNGDETWCITDGVETFPLSKATPTEFELALRGTIERARAEQIAKDAALAESEAATFESEHEEGWPAFNLNRVAAAIRAQVTPITPSPV